MLLPTLMILAVWGVTSSAANCDISVRDNVQKTMPLVLAENYHTMLYPVIPVGTPPASARKVVTIGDGKKMSIACPGRQLIVAGKVTTIKALTIVCKNGKFDTQPKNQVQFTDLKCAGVARFTVKTFSHTKQVGFQIDANRSPFIPQIIIRRTRSESGFYTYHKLQNSAAYSSSIVRKSNFMEGTCNINGKSADNFYQRTSQQKEINTIVGLPANSNNYVSNQRGTNKYLARGHLSPVSDFLYPAERDATNVCDNIAPQWQTFNNGNWRTIEAYVREIALKKGHLDVYTGVYQVATLKGKQLYLASGNQLPVPKYYWKIVRDKEFKTVLFVSLNNPYQGNMNTERSSGLMRLCKGACGRLSGLNTKGFDQLQRGLTECCEMNNQFLVELGLPAFVSKGLLTK